MEFACHRKVEVVREGKRARVGRADAQSPRGRVVRRRTVRANLRAGGPNECQQKHGSHREEIRLDEQPAYPATEERRSSDPGGHDQTELQRAKPDVVHAAALSSGIRSLRTFKSATMASSFISASISWRLNFAYSKRLVSERAASDRTSRVSRIRLKYSNGASAGTRPKPCERSALSMLA